MTCDIRFDFLSPHNGEYWYKCHTCGASDWFAYYDTPETDKPIRNCVHKRVESLDTKTQQMLIDAYKRGYAAGMEIIANLPKPDVTIQDVLKK